MKISINKDDFVNKFILKLSLNAIKELNIDQLSDLYVTIFNKSYMIQEVSNEE